MTIEELKSEIEGEIYTDETTRRLYATDASAYRELPLAVAIPRTNEDIIELVQYARKHKIGLIPRTAGTSLAGQVVGSGIVVDVSKHFNQILEINSEEGYAWVQPGIVRDDLNHHLREHGFFFAPETSTSNRAMIGGMIGNNSCGANSVIYGSTREHLLEVKAVIADGTEAWFGPLDNNGFIARCNGHNTTGDLHTNMYLNLKSMLFDETNQKEIINGYPKADIPRRNTGYALDMLLRQQPFDDGKKPFNFCELIAGSEGTLAFVTAAKIKLSPLPSEHKALVCIHAESIDQSLRANLVALKYKPSACELMDHHILQATKRNSMYEKYRFFVEGDPQAILVVEITRESEAEVNKVCEEMITELIQTGNGYSYPIVEGAADIKKVWGLRKAGLGLLSNTPGDAKAAPVIEDTAVDVEDLPAYIEEFNGILKKHDLYSVHYAHAGSGELHLRPIINLKTAEGRQQFRTIAEEIAVLVKKYNGSLSGEHGDGRLRGEFIPQMLGKHNYRLCEEVKKTWDPEGIFNPGKIVNTAPMDTHLRFEKDQDTPEFDTILDFSDNLGIVRAAEQCNGSGDCRKSEITGGVMCPSYMATRNEKDTTRARANILREMLTKTDDAQPFARKEIKEVMDLCLSCKGCKSECPSNVDVGKLKAEWQHQFYQTNGVPLRTRLIAGFTSSMKLASKVPWAYNLVFGNKLLGNIAKATVGFAGGRSMPAVSKTTLRKWFKSFKASEVPKRKTIWFFIDEFTDYNESEIGQKAIQLLDKLGYGVRVIDHQESGRTFLSKGLLEKARDIAKENIGIFESLINEETPLLGLEPSAILTFRDEYIDLFRGEMKEKARNLAKNTFTIEEFLVQEYKKGELSQDYFDQEHRKIKLHGHCHQKALSSVSPTKQLLSLPQNHSVEMIPSGCCGMAGSFGYEKEHFDVSMKIGELVLFPAVRSAKSEVLIAAPGTSCRHQIKDGTGRKALHPVEILFDSLAKN